MKRSNAVIRAAAAAAVLTALTFTACAVKASAPVLYNITMTNSGCVLRWQPQAEGAEYAILRSEAPDGESIEAGRTDKAVFVDREASIDASYIYKLVIAESSAAAAEYPATLLPPQAVCAVRTDDGAALISWEPVEGADSYIVFKVYAKLQPSVIAGRTTECSFVDTEPGAGAGGEVYYTVQACAETDGVYSLSAVTPQCALEGE